MKKHNISMFCSTDEELESLYYPFKYNDLVVAAYDGMACYFCDENRIETNRSVGEAEKIPVLDSYMEVFETISIKGIKMERCHIPRITKPLDFDFQWRCKVSVQAGLVCPACDHKAPVAFEVFEDLGYGLIEVGGYHYYERHLWMIQQLPMWRCERFADGPEVADKYLSEFVKEEDRGKLMPIYFDTDAGFGFVWNALDNELEEKHIIHQV